MTNSGFHAEITLDAPNLVFFSVPHDDGFTATVNGKETDILRVDEGLMAVLCPAGESADFVYQPDGIRLGKPVTLLSLVVFVSYTGILPGTIGKSGSTEEKESVLSNSVIGKNPASPPPCWATAACACPTLPDGRIDEVRAEALLNAARDAGVNYFDTAYPYHGGESEPFVGRVIAKWPRESFYLATKLPLWLCDSLEKAQQIYRSQFERLGVDTIDFYLLHSLHRARYDQAKALGIVDWLWEEKKAGRIRNFGFSCHDNADGLEHILRDQPWDFCQLQYNYLDTDDRAEEIAGDRGYALTEELGIPLIIMEPIKGGTLANLPPDAAAPLTALDPAASAASWALRWVGSHKNVHLILSGMSAEEQLADNLSTFAPFRPLNAAEDAAVAETARILHSRIKIGCTGYRYCMPCPMGVDIPDNFSIWNRLGMFGQPDAVRHQWTAQFPGCRKGQPLRTCGKCEAVCPQHLPIRTALAQLQTELDAL